MLTPESCDVCPKCKKKTMPSWDGLCTARSCQNCNFVEERKKRSKQNRKKSK